MRQVDIVLTNGHKLIQVIDTLVGVCLVYGMQYIRFPVSWNAALRGALHWSKIIPDFEILKIFDGICEDYVKL